MPDAFYKYYGAEALKLTLAHTTRKWSSPSEFNDPFDNGIDIQWVETPRDIESGIKLEIQTLGESESANLTSLNPVMYILVQLYKGMNADMRQKMINGLDGVYSQEQLNEMYSKSNMMTNAVLSDISIFCITESHDNLLMWSHYADNHKGGVVKLLPIKEVDSPLTLAQRVNYSATIPSLSFLSMLKNSVEFRREVISAITLTKGKGWEYEKEWRIVSQLRDPRNKHEIIPFAKEEIDEVYLGCRISDENKNAIIDIVNMKYPWVSIYQAKQKRNEFSLIFEKINNPRERLS